MTKKDYISISAGLRKYLETFCDKEDDYVDYGDIISVLSDIFEKENNRFNRELFKEACGV